MTRREMSASRRCGRRWSSTGPNPTCAACHKIMDPIGFSLENFDAVGMWRNEDEGLPIDASGVLVDGTILNGPASLRNALLRYSDQYVRVVTEKLLTYALGRGTDAADMPVVRSIVREAAGNDYRFSAIVMGIVKSVPFQMNTKDTGAGSRRDSVRELSMFLTKKSIPRRTFLRGGAVTLALPLLDAMVPSGTLLAQTAARPKSRFVGIFVPHGMAPGYWVPSAEGSGFTFPMVFTPLEQFRDQTVILSGLHGRSSEPPPGVSGADHWVAAAFLCANKPRKTVGRRRLRRHHGRSGDRSGDRARHAPAVDAAGGRGSRFERQQLRRRLQLRLYQHHLLADADQAAADGAEPAGDLRADVRRREHRRRAGAPAPGRSQHPGLAHPGLSRFRVAVGAGDRRRLDEYLEDVREIERRLQIAAKASETSDHDRDAVRHPRVLRRAHQAPVRPHGARVSGGYHPCRARCSTPAT